MDQFSIFSPDQFLILGNRARVRLIDLKILFELVDDYQSRSNQVIWWRNLEDWEEKF